MASLSEKIMPLEATLKRCKDLEDFCRRNNSKEIKLDIRDFYNLMSLAEPNPNWPESVKVWWMNRK